MNMICLDTTRTSAAWPSTRMDPHQFATAHKGDPFARAGMGSQASAGTRISLQNSVGKSFANWMPFVANWTQLAEPCQLKTQYPCGLAVSWQLATKNELANLPTGRKPAWMLDSYQKSSWRKLPSPYGRGRQPRLKSVCPPLAQILFAQKQRGARDPHTPAVSQTLVKGGRHHG